MLQHSRLFAVGAALALALWAPTACGSTSTSLDPAAAPAKGPAGHAGHAVARTDVDGDGSRDVVTYRVVSDDRVRVGVRTGAADSTQGTAYRVLDTELWPGRGGYWHGAAPLDGEPGAELFVGTAMGAHTPLFTVLTMRSGRLTVQPNPQSGQSEWWVDAFTNGYTGWTRSTAGGEVQVAVRTIFRRGTGQVWTGAEQSFRWSDGGWARDRGSDVRIRGDRAAARIGGWHVQGLPRWPNL